MVAILSSLASPDGAGYGFLVQAASPKVSDSPKAQHEISNILLLEDDTVLADALKPALEAKNCVVTVVHNGVDGLNEVMALDFDLILCDLMMPRMPGDMFFYAVERVRPHLARRFLFITGYAQDPKFDDFLRSTRARVLIKPFEPGRLVSEVTRLLAAWPEMPVALPD